MDHKVADLRKKLNKLKFVTSTKKDKLKGLMKEYEKVVRLNTEMVKTQVTKKPYLFLRSFCLFVF